MRSLIRIPTKAFIGLLCLSAFSSFNSQELVLPVGHTEDIFATNFLRSGQYILTSAYDNNSKLWDVYSGRILHTFPKLAHSAKESTIGINNSFQLMQELFVDVGRSTGATVISAAAGTQFALEKSDLQNGVFTYSILEYMKSNPSATVSELRSYVNKRVRELTGGLQVPTTRSSPVNYDWQVW